MEVGKQLVNGIKYSLSNDVLTDAKLIINSSQQAAYRAVNASLVLRNWFLGRRIVEEELRDTARSELYGNEIIADLAKDLTREFGRGYTKRSLYQFVQFFRMFPEIVQTASAQSPSILTWSHYVELLRVEDSAARAWYEHEAFEQSWSVRILRRNIDTQYYHRLLMSSNADQLKPNQIDLENVEGEVRDRLEFVKSPFIAEFLGISPDERLRESELEAAIIANLQKFLLELGKGYAFVSRQQHIHSDAGDFFIDLVFYNIILKCYVLIDLKVGQITHQDVGQMDMYVRMYDELKREKDDNPTLGIVLCSETSKDIARYSILHGNEQLFASKYRLYLPTEEQLRMEIEAQKELFRLQQGIPDE